MNQKLVDYCFVSLVIIQVNALICSLMDIWIYF